MRDLTYTCSKSYRYTCIYAQEEKLESVNSERKLTTAPDLLSPPMCTYVYSRAIFSRSDERAGGCVPFLANLALYRARRRLLDLRSRGAAALGREACEGKGATRGGAGRRPVAVCG